MKTARFLALVVVVASAWAFFEWLFFVTKPSFMTLYTSWDKLNVLASSALIVSCALLLVTLPFLVLARLLARLKLNDTALILIGAFPAIVVLGLSMLVLVDNFTLTLFGWGIRDSAGVTVLLYKVVMLGLLLLAARLAHGFVGERFSRATRQSLTIGSLALLAASIPFLLQGHSGQAGISEIDAEDVEKHNIIILSGDGIAAVHMSAYGYERATTPFLESVADEFLVAENFYTNASDTGGSVISMMTGKLPTTTRVVYPPDTLRGKDSFQHLPGILKRMGYYNADVSMRHYADPYDLNLRDGFAEANFRRLKESGGIFVATIRSVPALNPASLLIDRMSERVVERFDHIWRGKIMQDPLAEVNTPDERWITDEDRLNEIGRFIETVDEPFFLNVHTMGTHGERFRPSQRVFSTEEDYEVLWSIDGYDDAILDFDRHVRWVYEKLRERGLLERTILVITSDHGFKHNSLERLPMMMRLPNTSRTGTIKRNTQRIDLAPTLLEVLGIATPAWMEGRSMLSPPPADAPKRPVFATHSHGDKAADGNFWSVVRHEPPWYSMGRLYLVYCDQGFYLTLQDMEIRGGRIVGSTHVCEQDLSNAEARELMQNHLREKGYDWE